MIRLYLRFTMLVLFNFLFVNIALAAPSPISPSGEITNQLPTYQWESVDNAESYTLGLTVASQWKEFTVSSTAAGCPSVNQTCSYTPQETLSIGKAFTWYVKSNNESWADIHSGLSIEVVTSNIISDIEQLSPYELSSSKNPWYQWKVDPDASSYTVQLTVGSDVHEFTVTERQARCHASVHKKCFFRVPGASLLNYGDNVVWKIKANNLHDTFNDGIEFEVARRVHRYVSKEHPNASDSNSGYRNSPWKTISHAIEKIDATLKGKPKFLHVQKGTYYELIEFTDIDHLIIQGEVDSSGNLLTIIDGSLNIDPWEVVPFDSNEVYRKGIISAFDSDDLLISRIAVKNTKRHGIYIKYKEYEDEAQSQGQQELIRNVTVSDSLTENTRGSGILIYGIDPFEQYRFKNVTVKRNTILDPEMGLWPNNARRLWNEDITLAGGIDVFDISFNTVDSNGAENNYNNSKIWDGGPLAIDVKDGIMNGNIHHNTVKNIPSGGIYLDGSSVAGGVHNVDVYSNLVTNVLGAGIQISGELGGTVVDAHVFNNIITSSYTGLACDNNNARPDIPQGIKQVTFRNNTIHDAEIGAWIDSSDSLCKVNFRNNIISTSNNKPDLYSYISMDFSDSSLELNEEKSFDIAYWGSLSGVVSINKNCFHNNEIQNEQGTNPVIATSPIFIDAATGNFKLVTNSECAGKGANTRGLIGAN